MQAAKLPTLPRATQRKLPDWLVRKEIPLSRSRRLLAKRERGSWVIGYYSQSRSETGWRFSEVKWGWRTGESPTLALALQHAGVPDSDARQIETYLLDVIYP